MSGTSEPSPESVPQGSLSELELRQMIQLLYRHAVYDMDQWDMWKFPTPYGDMSVLIRMGLQPGYDERTHTDLSRFLNDG